MGRIPTPHTGNTEQDRAWRAVDEAISELYSQHGVMQPRGAVTLQTNTGVSTANTWQRSYSRSTGQAVSIRGVAQAPSSGAYTASAIPYTLIPNQKIQIETTGRPVLLMFLPVYTTGSPTAAIAVNQVAAAASMSIRLLRDGTVITEMNFVIQVTGAPGLGISIPPGAFSFMDLPLAGAHSYQAQVTSADNIQISYVSLTAVEL